MAIVTEQPTLAWAHCVQARCPGNDQVEVDAVKVETGHTYEDLGGEWPFVERSHVSVRFADEDETVCPHCGGPRDLSMEKRKQYDPLSGHDPRGLLDIKDQGLDFNPNRQIEIQRSPVADAEREEMQRENADLRERLAKLEGYILGQQAEPAEPEPER